MNVSLQAKCSDFANAIGVEPHFLIGYIEKWAKHDDHDIILAKLKIQYVDDCVIRKNTSTEFLQSIRRIDELATRLQTVYREVCGDQEADNLDPLCQIMLSTDMKEPLYELYLDVIRSMKKSHVKIASKLLDCLLKNYADLQVRNTIK